MLAVTSSDAYTALHFASLEVELEISFVRATLEGCIRTLR